MKYSVHLRKLWEEPLCIQVEADNPAAAREAAKAWAESRDYPKSFDSLVHVDTRALGIESGWQAGLPL